MTDPLAADPAPRESVVARLRPHVRALILPTVLLVAVAAAFGYLGGSFPETWQNLTAVGVAAVLVLVGWLMPFASWLARHYTITTRRIVIREGVFVRTRQEVLHSRVTAVTVRQGPIQSVIGSGDVVLERDNLASVVLSDVPGPTLVATALDDLASDRGADRGHR